MLKGNNALRVNLANLGFIYKDKDSDTIKINYEEELIDTDIKLADLANDKYPITKIVGKLIVDSEIKEMEELLEVDSFSKYDVYCVASNIKFVKKVNSDTRGHLYEIINMSNEKILIYTSHEYLSWFISSIR